MTEPSGKPDSSGRTWQSAPGVWWAVEADGIVLGGPGAQSARSVAYPEAAVWDLLSRGRRIDDVAVMIEAIASVSPASARHIVGGCLRTWIGAGLLAEVASDG